MIKSVIDKIRTMWRNSHFVTAFERKIPALSRAELNSRMSKLPEVGSVDLKRLDENIWGELYGRNRRGVSRNIFS